MSRIIRVSAILFLLVFSASISRAQQTLGSINGTVTDSSGAVLSKVSVKVKNAATNLEVSATTRDDGSYQVTALPIGKYSVTFSFAGFNNEVHSEILVQGGLTTTVNGSLRPGTVSATVEVMGTPLLNSTDSTIGYTLGADIIQNTPLGTGSFTQLALLSPGVNADFLTGSGTNAGLGNQNIFANGQRDTSNSFIVNGVQANNIFNGKSSSGVADNRAVLNTGEVSLSQSIGGEVQTSTSVYSAIGQALPSPAPEMLEEVHVNTSMYDASEGAYSGAHITLLTKSGSNDLHGGAYEFHQTDAWNATPFFFNADPALHNPNGPTHGNPRPYLKRNTFGADLGGPIIKNKLFFFAAYQGQRAVDQDNSFSGVTTLSGLTDSNRSAGCLAMLANNSFGTSLTAADISPVAVNIMNLKLPNGQYFIPSVNVPAANQQQLGFDAIVVGPHTTFNADQVVGNIDYIFSTKDRLSGKYYFQNDPTYAPFAISQAGNFPQTLSAGSQTFSLENAITLSPNAVWTQHFGFLRQRAFAHTTDGYKNSDYGMTIFGLSTVPGISITHPDFSFNNGFAFGPASNFANAGIFQNNFEGSTKYSWTLGRHTFAFGFAWEHMQLNVENRNNQTAELNFSDFSSFLTGSLCTPAAEFGCGETGPSTFIGGASSRHYRADQVGAFAQDTYRFKQNLTITLGLRWDWDGPLTEKNGLLANFYPSKYSYVQCAVGGVASDPITGGAPCDPGTDIITGTGIVVAGNNKTFGTKGVSDSTLTGRQWGFAPRIGIAWTPSFAKNLVVRMGYGLYYDRGEYLSELSPSAGGNYNGPFGVTVAPPFVVPLFSQPGASFSAPFAVYGNTPPQAPTSLAGIASLLPNITSLEKQTTPFCSSISSTFFCSPAQFAAYAPGNKLPYSENWMFDLQWQPRNDLVFTLSYVGNHGQHENIPVPFNQPGTATAGSPIHGQTSTYGYNVVPAENIFTLVQGFTSGNVDLRVPYIGFDPNSQYNEAAGISNYDALQFNVTKRVSHGLTFSASYTWSHAMDEESGEQLFYNGDNPQNLRTGYGNSDFDRRHVLIATYQYEFPKLSRLHGWADKVVNGWGTSGVISAESGQPFSVIDFSGGAASVFFGGGNDFVTNPLVPIGGVGSTSTKAVLQGTTGYTVSATTPYLNPAAFGIPLLTPNPAVNGIPLGDNLETGFGPASRNIFRGPFQSRVDVGAFKNFKITERFRLKFDVQAFNILNHPSFDTPNNNVEFNPFFSNPPQYFAPFPQSGQQNCTSNAGYVCPPSGQLGIIQHTIGSPRFLQMALHLTF
jgi:carboxypeptidase family protein/TonB-dependent receptor-like protein